MREASFCDEISAIFLCAGICKWLSKSAISFMYCVHDESVYYPQILKDTLNACVPSLSSKIIIANFFLYKMQEREREREKNMKINEKTLMLRVVRNECFDLCFCKCEFMRQYLFISSPLCLCDIIIQQYFLFVRNKDKEVND